MLRICGFLDPDCTGTGFLHQLEGSLLTLRRRKCKCFAFADWNAPLGAGGTGGHQLRPQFSPRAGVSLAGEHNPDRSPRNSNLIVQPTVLARSLFVRPEVEELQSRIGQGGTAGLYR